MWLTDYWLLQLILLIECIRIKHSNIIHLWNAAYLMLIKDVSVEGLLQDGLCFGKYPQAKWIVKQPVRCVPMFWNLYDAFHWDLYANVLFWFSNGTNIISYISLYTFIVFTLNSNSIDVIKHIILNSIKIKKHSFIKHTIHFELFWMRPNLFHGISIQVRANLLKLIENLYWDERTFYFFLKFIFCSCRKINASGC